MSGALLNNLRAYLPYLPALVLLLTALLLLALALARPRFSYHWLLAVLGALLAWPLAAFALQTPSSSQVLVIWLPEIVYNESPTLLMDAYAWPFVFALATLALSVILTDVARAGEANWSVWSGCLFLVSLGMLAVGAGNPLTLALAWSAIDLVELLILLSPVQDSAERERLVVGFSARVGGTLLLVGTDIAAAASGASLRLDAIDPGLSPFLLLAAGLRLGVLPLHQPYLKEAPLRRSLGTTSRLVSAASGLILLVRASLVGLDNRLAEYALGLACLAGLYASLSWLRARDELDGRPYWLLGLGSLALASAVQRRPDAALSWSIALLLAGGLLFLYSGRHRSFIALVGLGMLGFIGLPFTPNAGGMGVYGSYWLSNTVMMLVHSLLVMGYLRHGLRQTPALSGVERWVWVIYPWGLTLLPLVHFGLGWWWMQQNIASSTLPLPWQGVLAGLLAGLWFFAALRLSKRKGWQAPIERFGSTITHLLSLEWLYLIIWRVYRSFGNLFRFFSTVVEGEGGVLWALLLLVLLMTYLSQSSGGANNLGAGLP